MYNRDVNLLHMLTVSQVLGLTRRVDGSQLLQRGGWLSAQQSSANVQSLSLQDGAHLYVQLVSVVTAVPPHNTQEPEEHQWLRKVNLEAHSKESHVENDLVSSLIVSNRK